MRILHSADWHLGLQLHGVSLLEEQRAAAELLVKTVREERIDAVVLAGDLFDRAVSPPEAIALYNALMQALCIDCQVAVLICAGNHDGAARLSACAGLLRKSGLYITGALEDAFAPVVIRKTAFFLLPWFHNDQARQRYPGEEIRETADAMRLICGELRTHLVAGARNILIAHCFAAGGQAGESDRTAAVGGAGRVPLDLFDGFDYVALGHLHRPQQLATHVRYSGTPYPYSFSEAGQEKSFTLLDTETMTQSLLPVKAGRGLRVLRGSFDTLRETAAFDPQREDYIKAELTDCTAGAEKLAILRESWPNLLLLEGREPQDGAPAALRMRDLSVLTPRALVIRFCEEIGGRTPDEEELGWFEQAAALEGGELQ